MPGAPPVDPLRDVAPLAKLIDIPIVLVSNPKIGPKSVKELLERAKANPNGISFGSMGVNSGAHLSMELLAKDVGVKLVHVPYRGSAPAVTDLLGGQIPWPRSISPRRCRISSRGQLIALGLSTIGAPASRPIFRPSREAGVPGFGKEPGFIGIFAPPATPPDVLKKLTGEIAAVLAMPDVQSKARLLAAQVAYLDNVAFGKFLAAQSANWKKSLVSLGLAN